MAQALLLRIRGLVTSAECRIQRTGCPVVLLEMTDAATGQTIHVRHTYPDASSTSNMAAHALARRLRGQQAELDAINPRFKAHRLDCDAAWIHTPTNLLKDYQQ